MRIDLFLAFKFIRDARAQTTLIASGVGVGVAVVVFLSSLISGLQSDLIRKTVGSQAHIVVESVAERARPLRSKSPRVTVLRRVEETEQRVRSIDGWQKQLARIERLPGVRVVSPVARGPALAIRGSVSENVVVVGAEPSRFNGIIDVKSRMVAGAFSITGRDIVVGSRLARELGIGAGDVIRLQTADGQSATADVRGIFELGAKTADGSWVVTSLPTAQSLLELPGGATAIEVSVEDVFAAEDIAATIRSQSGLRTESWMESNAELLTALNSQSASSWMIQVFVLVAVAIGIASVLIVSVVQRRREIGILRAMGVSRRTAKRVFLFQGAIVGLVGSILGSGLGAAIAILFRRIAVGPSGAPLFPIELDPARFIIVGLIATSVGVIAALFPAARAAKLDPVVAIRNE